MTDQLDTDPLTRQLVQQAQLISRLRHDLDQLASEITDAYADLLSRIETLNGQPTGRPSTASAWCWRTLGEQAAEELWTQLKDWVDWIRHRYPLAKKIPPCWPEHPEVVEELTALWLAWQAAYEQPDPQLTAAADWHDRWLPGVLHRLEHGPHAVNCGDAHAARPAAAYAHAAGRQTESEEHGALRTSFGRTDADDQVGTNTGSSANECGSASI